jgi:hypothetical protein
MAIAACWKAATARRAATAKAVEVPNPSEVGLIVFMVGPGGCLIGFESDGHDFESRGALLENEAMRFVAEGHLIEPLAATEADRLAAWESCQCIKGGDQLLSNLNVIRLESGLRRGTGQ